MIRRFFTNIAHFVDNFINDPIRVILVCATLLALGLVFDGSLFRLWRLHRDNSELNARITSLKQDSKSLIAKIQRAQDPHFIELEAREKFDLAAEGDLVFIFSDDE